MEALHLAGEHAKVGRDGERRPARDGGDDGVDELDLARAVMTDAVYLAQLAPGCFHEVVARVARKTEPELHSLLFPIHVGDEARRGRSGSGNGRESAVKPDWESSSLLEGGDGGSGDDDGYGPDWGRWAHPTHLFHDCLVAGKLTTAAWYLPLIRDDTAYNAARR